MAVDPSKESEQRPGQKAGSDDQVSGPYKSGSNLGGESAGFGHGLAAARRSFGRVNLPRTVIVANVDAATEDGGDSISEIPAYPPNVEQLEHEAGDATSSAHAHTAGVGKLSEHRSATA